MFEKGTGQEVIQLYDLATHQISSLPDSQGLWTSRWSPDGRYMAALAIAKQQLMVFDFRSGKWRDLHVGDIDNPVWSHDRKYIYFSFVRANWNAGIFRVRLSDGQRERVAKFDGMRHAMPSWHGLAPDDSPMVLRDIGTQEIYRLDVEWP